MAPTHGQEEIEGRYKEYAYSPVPASSTSAVYDSTTLAKYPVDIGAGSPKYRTYGVYEKCRVAEMAEKGSTLLQYVAAAAGKFQPFYCSASFRRSLDRGLGSRAMRPVSIRAPAASAARFSRDRPSLVNPETACQAIFSVGKLSILSRRCGSIALFEVVESYSGTRSVE